MPRDQRPVVLTVFFCSIVFLSNTHTRFTNVPLKPHTHKKFRSSNSIQRQKKSIQFVLHRHLELPPPQDRQLLLLRRRRRLTYIGPSPHAHTQKTDTNTLFCARHSRPRLPPQQKIMGATWTARGAAPRNPPVPCPPRPRLAWSSHRGSPRGGGCAARACPS